MRRLFALFLVLCLLMPCGALAGEAEPVEYTSGDYEYIVLEDGTAEITGYNGKAEVLAIPEELDGMAISSIGERAFSYCDNLTSITIPDSVAYIGPNPFVGCKSLANIVVSPDHPSLATIDGVLFSKADKRLVCYPQTLTADTYSIPQGIFSIGKRAFYRCTRLQSVTIPDSVTSIGEEAFSYCNSLVSISLPDTVTSVEGNPFKGCENLISIVVSPENSALATIDGVLFSKADKKLVCYPCAFTSDSYSIPQGILSIGDWAFLNCFKLQTITIPDSVTSIGNGAYCYCVNLQSITLPDSVTSIGNQAFSSCRSLTSITLPDSIASIGDWAFSECWNLISITIPDSVTNIEKHSFANCRNLTTITVDRDSYAKQWCIDNGFNYTYPDANDWLNN